MIRDKVKIRIQEIIAKGKLEVYSEDVDKIIRSIYEAKCNISCDDLARASMHTFVDGIGYIRIGMLGRTKPLQVIWDILHEFGHFLSGELSKGQNTGIEREELAWELGLKELKKYPNLFKFYSDFELYKEECLDTHRKRTGD